MQQVYQARYSDGQSAKPFTVFVHIEDHNIVIQYGTVVQKWEQSAFRETELRSSILTLQHGIERPYKQLEVTDPSFIALYRQTFKPRSRKRSLQISPARGFLLLLFGFVATLVVAYVYVLPFVADRVAQHFPQEYEVSMGQQLMDSYLTETKIDAEKTSAINQFFKQLHIETTYPVKIVVVKDSIVNAFAMPGGGIVVYDEMLKRMDKPEQLAALLSHEFSHVQLKHATRNIFRSIAGSLFISMVLSDVNGITNLVVANAHQLRNLQYSRELEHEADANGLNILKQNSIDASGMSDLFRLLKQQQSEEPDEVFSTHPELESRINFVQSFQQEHPYKPVANDSLLYYFTQLHP